MAPSSSVLNGSVLAVVQSLGGAMHSVARDALAGGLGSVDVELRSEHFPVKVQGQPVDDTPEGLVEKAVRFTKLQFAQEEVEVEAETRVNNRTRSAKVKLRVRKRTPKT